MVKGKPKSGRTKKVSSQKTVLKQVKSDDEWKIVYGKLVRPPGRPSNTKSLFKVFGEKIPKKFLNEVCQQVVFEEHTQQGVYIAHDSMGYPRYVGRGSVFTRLKARFNSQPRELSYFSFFIVEEKMHEREIETIMIRAAGPMLDFNDRKVRTDINAGSPKDFEAGAYFFERQRKKGPRATKKKPA